MSSMISLKSSKGYKKAFGEAINNNFLYFTCPILVCFCYYVSFPQIAPQPIFFLLFLINILTLFRVKITYNKSDKST